MRRRVAAVAVGVAALAVMPAVLSDARTSELASAGAYVVAIAGLDLLARRAGRLSLGHGAFMAAGGYAAAALAAHHGVPALATIPAAAAVAAAVGVVVGLASLRMPGAALAVPTFGLAIAAPWLLARAGRLTVPDAPSPLLEYALSWILAGLLLVLAMRLAASRFGRSLRALADNDQAAVTSGVGRTFHSLAALGVSAAFAGVAGSLLTLGDGGIGPASFPAQLSLLLVAAAAIGGLGSLVGAVPAGLALQYLPGLVGLERSGAGPSTFVFGVLLVVLVLLSPLVAATARLRAHDL